MIFRGPFQPNPFYDSMTCILLRRKLAKKVTSYQLQSDHDFSQGFIFKGKLEGLTYFLLLLLDDINSIIFSTNMTLISSKFII